MTIAVEREHDLTQMRRADDQYRLLFELNPLPMWLFDAETLRFLEVNDAAVTHYGYTRAEFLAMTVASLPPSDAECAELRASISHHRDQSYRGLHRHRRKDGSVIDVEITSHPISLEGTKAKLVIAHDVSEREQVLALLREREQRFRAIIEQGSDVVRIADESGITTYVSPSAERVLGFGPTEMVGRSVLEFVHQEDQARVREALAELTRGTHELAALEMRHRHRDGTWRTLVMSGRNLLREPAVRGVVLHSRDITDQKALEAQLRQSQKIEAVGQLAGGVAHDFNNLLTVINFHTELLLEGTEPVDPSYEDLVEIQKASRRAGSLTRQLLAFSRKQLLQPRLLDLSAVLADLEPMLRRLIGEDIQMVCIAGTDPHPVMADRGQLEQALVNLVLNARDAMPNGGTLSIEAANIRLEQLPGLPYASVVPGQYVLLTVSDTGTGMSGEVQSHMFEPFFTTKEPGRGTGLGLSTVYGTVKQSGGYILCDSEPSRGTTFRIYLPRAASGQETAAAASVRTAPAGTEVLLLVEDEEPVRRLSRRILERQGYTVLEARHGADALRVASEYGGEIHGVVSDVVMPEMNGRTMAEQLATLRPNVRVLFVSGYTDDDIIRRGLLDPGMAFLQKPFTAQSLAMAVREMLDAPAPRTPGFLHGRRAD
ncbi:MAG TPA: PAS domain S-box protein [Gemmatimonadaceae bacterium]|nr:PAS domain S-box protein [Gemmatimonadaceae bacterium]